ncbi:hypothetical protein [Burkholderia sp. HI2714]|uniref:hypothetical protein n=1 Tax=Burkholderia sp. HI2714 TaxID=2015359 RepID=UPI0011804CC4|nr:hypothetical protein [Burkholderia sp. HI2714]
MLSWLAASIRFTRIGLSVYCAAVISGLSVAALAFRLRCGWSDWNTDAQRFTYAPPVTLKDAGFTPASCDPSVTALGNPGSPY